jgi:hypothetical protein
VFISASTTCSRCRCPEEMADAIEDKPMNVKLTPDVVSLAFLERVLQACAPQSHGRFSAVDVDSFVYFVP